eukprot:125415-Pyramimonas_sp.AAC.1
MRRKGDLESFGKTLCDVTIRPLPVLGALGTRGAGTVEEVEEGDTAEWDGKDRDEDGTDEVHEDRDGENQAGK